MNPLRHIFTALTLALLTACTMGPDYVRPTAPTPSAFKEAGGWIKAQPSDAINRGAWWAIYKDPILDSLEQQVTVSNQNLKASEAAYRQASAVADETFAGLFPTLSLDKGSTYTGSGQPHSKALYTYKLSANTSWDLDVWGRIRRQLESDEANIEVSSADLASSQLSAQATLASDYFALRIQDELRRLLDNIGEADRKSLEIIQNRYESGVVTKVDVLQASTQLENVRTQAINTGVQRAKLEHAIAVLIGKSPADYTLAPAPFHADPLMLPIGLPSALLERRPDIASAERQVAAANAEIGVAEAAYFPDITLAASYGYTSVVLAKLLQTTNSLWSIGSSLTQTAFDAGARDAHVDQARAAYDETVANYRQTVLTAFQQVEDNLAALRILKEQAQIQQTTVESARQAEALTLNQYKEGIIPYTNVLVAQTTRLSNEQSVLSLYGSRLAASVALIQSLGGGWDATQLPH